MVCRRHGEGCEPPDFVPVAQGGAVGTNVGKAPSGTPTAEGQRVGGDQMKTEPFCQRLQPRRPLRAAAPHRGGERRLFLIVCWLLGHARTRSVTRRLPSRASGTRRRTPDRVGLTGSRPRRHFGGADPRVSRADGWLLPGDDRAKATMPVREGSDRCAIPMSHLARPSRHQARRRDPDGRSGRPDEVAPCAVFLASEDDSHVSVQVLRPDVGTAVGSLDRSTRSRIDFKKAYPVRGSAWPAASFVCS
jgi:hypothetical protein